MNAEPRTLNAGVSEQQYLLTGELDVPPEAGGFGHFERAERGKDEWLTPPGVIRALGEFDLDPCAPRVRPWEMAKQHYTFEDNGLIKPWLGRVWCNPPYGDETGKWLGRCHGHGNAIALTFARTETRMFHEHVWAVADAVFFFKGRLTFHHVNGEPGEASPAPSCLICFGWNNVAAVRCSGLSGKMVLLKPEGNSQWSGVGRDWG